MTYLSSILPNLLLQDREDTCRPINLPGDFFWGSWISSAISWYWGCVPFIPSPHLLDLKEKKTCKNQSFPNHAANVANGICADLSELLH